MRKLVFILIGLILGLTMYKAEAASWFRIYEMFNFQSFHMYGFIGSALIIGIGAIQWIKQRKIKDMDGQQIQITPKEKTFSRYLFGGIIFGLGWALAGACPLPMFVLVGAGVFPILIVILGAVAGTWLYGLIRHKLPH